MEDPLYSLFMKYTDKTDSCWLWTGNKTKSGYGRFGFNYKTYSAHRYSYIHFKGQIPDNMVVRHICRNKCVNPEHLELGTHKQNTEDRKRDGTYQYGEKNPRVKLTKEQVEEIRSIFPNKTISQLAKDYNITWTQIKNIVTFKSWNLE